jgi:hypothetical protein
MAVPVLLYDGEISTLIKNDERRTETAELKFFSHLQGYTLHDRTTDDGVRE